MKFNYPTQDNNAPPTNFFSADGRARKVIQSNPTKIQDPNHQGLTPGRGTTFHL